MSSIPNAKMKHAHVAEGGEPGQHDAPKGGKRAKAKAAAASLTDKARELGDYAQDLAGEAVDAVKARPKTAAAIGAAIVAGAAAIVGGPAAARALRGDDKKDGTKKPAKKKG